MEAVAPLFRACQTPGGNQALSARRQLDPAGAQPALLAQDPSLGRTGAGGRFCCWTGPGSRQAQPGDVPDLCGCMASLRRVVHGTVERRLGVVGVRLILQQIDIQTAAQAERPEAADGGDRELSCGTACGTPDCPLRLAGGTAPAIGCRSGRRAGGAMAGAGTTYRCLGNMALRRATAYRCSRRSA